MQTPYLKLLKAKCCAADRSARDQLDKECAQQETKLAVLWTIGVFALNFGPVIVGGVLDLIGPKLTSMLGNRCSACPQANTTAGRASEFPFMEHAVS